MLGDRCLYFSACSQCLVLIEVDLGAFLVERVEPACLRKLLQLGPCGFAALATELYGASGIYFEKRARKKLERFVDLGFGGLPVCMAKTQSSLSDNGRLLGAPTGWQLTVSDVNLSAGAGFLVVVCGDMLLMPGLPRVPAAAGIDVDDAGRITGLF